MIDRFNVFLLAILLLAGCTPKCQDEVDTEKIQVSLNYKRLEKDLFKATTPSELNKFINTHSYFMDQYFHLPERDTNELIKAISDFYSTPALKEFYEDGEKKNDNFSNLPNELTTLFKHTRYHFPKYYIPEVNTVVSGFYNPPLVLSDSLFVISIDYFYGESARFRPEEYQYIKKKISERLPVILNRFFYV